MASTLRVYLKTNKNGKLSKNLEKILKSLGLEEKKEMDRLYVKWQGVPIPREVPKPLQKFVQEFSLRNSDLKLNCNCGHILEPGIYKTGKAVTSVFMKTSLYFNIEIRSTNFDDLTTSLQKALGLTDSFNVEMKKLTDENHGLRDLLETMETGDMSQMSS